MIKEIEIKLKLRNNEKINKKLKRLGGENKKPYTQTTYGFFSSNSIKRGIFPRIRIEEGIPVLTIKVKNKRAKKERDAYFERDEYSVKISNFRMGVKLLELLSFNRIRKFTKTREEWIFRERPIKAYIDKLYFGRFLELEGSKKEIEKMINDLGLKDRKRITKAYLALEDEYKERRN